MKNQELLIAVCKEIEPLLDQLVLVGGCATELLVTDIAAPMVRPTQDVDMIIDVISLSAYHETEQKLRDLGFTQTMDGQNIICRWTKNNLILDLIPTDEKILGFTNRWYAHAIQYSQKAIIENTVIHHISAVIFIATKLEAFYSRGKGDYFASHDLEDLIAIIDGRDELIDEIQDSPQDVIVFICQSISQFLRDNNFEDALAGLLPPDAAGQARLGRLIEKLNLIAGK